MELVDTHAHLDFPELYGDIEGIFKRAREQSVTRIITIGISIESSIKAFEIASSFEHIFSSAGIHPHGARLLTEKEVAILSNLLSHEKVVAVGEIGLDYYRDRQPRDIQRKCFYQQLELAIQVRKPAIFHVRDAFEDFLTIVKPFSSKLKASVLHCFSGDVDIAFKCIELGFLISIPGVVTYPKAETLQEVVKKVPLEFLLLETDAPFLTPIPHRGKPNEPSYVFYTAKKVAELKSIGIEEVAKITTNNALKVFGLKT